jgi:hypothetical protein
MECQKLWLFSPNVVRVFRSRGNEIGWTCGTHRRRGVGARTEIWWGKLSDRDHLENLGVDDMIILQWILMKMDGSADWIDLVQIAGCCEQGDERLCYIKCGEFLGQIRNLLHGLR